MRFYTTKLTKAFIIGLLMTGNFTVLSGAEIPAARYLSLSNEAMAAARYQKAISLSEEFLDNNINNSTCTSEILASHLFNLRNAYAASGKEKEYEEYCRRLFNKIEAGRGSTLIRAFFLISLDCKGDFDATSAKRHSFKYFGDNSAGIEFFDANVAALPQNLLDSKPVIKAWIPILRADLLAYGNDFEGAGKELDSAAQILRDNFEADAPEILLERFAREILAAQQENWEEAIRIGLENKKVLEKSGTPSKELYAVNSRLLQYYTTTGEYEKAAQIAKDGIVRTSVFDATPSLIDYRSFEGPMLTNSPSNIFAGRDYNLACINGAIAMFENNDIEGATKNANRVLYSLEKDIAANYSGFAFNRASSSDKGKVDLLVQSSPSLALRNPQDSLLQALAYDAALVYKQLSLSAGNFYRNIASRLGNEAISKRYQELEQSRKLLDIIAPEQADSLIQRIAQLESYLERNLKSRNQTSLGSLPRWTDVKNALSAEEAAIEFSIASTPHGDKYIASLVTKDSPYPKVVELCETGAVNDLKDHCKSTQTYELLWKPVLEELPGIKTLYFSPVGNLSLLPIEYVPINEKEMLNDAFSMFRLSSTRELALREQPGVPEQILLYGGVKYDLDDTEKAANEKEAEKATDRFFSDSFEIEEAATPGLRAGVAYLPATLDEIHNIGDIFRNAGKNAETVEGAIATETSVKELTGKNLPVLHIATHGFTVPKKSRTRLGRFLAKNDDRSTFEEQSLGRSGLMLAGAANTIDSKEDANSGFDDGILTGREISRLDFSGINTMVLSACESGLGEIGAEGVLGLQRGLKRAGVRTLVMSLWKVDDEGTSLLMAEFYRNLLTGKDAAMALRDAQKYLRTYDGGRFDDPNYWAAFIILDAI